EFGTSEVFIVKLIVFTCKTCIRTLHVSIGVFKDSEYVVAVRNYITENRAHLSFHKGDIIRLQYMKGLEAGKQYGCIVRKKVMLLEELKRDTPEFGRCESFFISLCKCLLFCWVLIFNTNYYFH
uniref:SH3 domain-containing protein n=1 Tax=Oryzias latipes TaxID=8090 RepID=A0A3P9KLP9_ORYLA